VKTKTILTVATAVVELLTRRKLHRPKNTNIRRRSGIEPNSEFMV